MSSVADPFTPKASQVTTPAGAFQWLYLLFFLSGISGLMYEVVWVRMLTRILGSTVYATATVLAAFMAGLALGSWLVGRFIDRVQRPLAWYAVLELGIGFSALSTLALPEKMVPLYRGIFDLVGGSRAGLTAGQVLIALIVLLVPTAFMGATLPTLCAHGARHRGDFGRLVGVLYGLNTLGAVAGVLASGFVLLGEVGETFTVLLGVLLNVVIGATAGLLGWWSMRRSAIGPEPANRPETLPEPNAAALYPVGVRRTLVLCFAVSGFVALANEVVWSRMLLLYQGTSIYSFSSMLAVVLAGMAIGSFLGGQWVKRWADPLRQLARLQLAGGLAAGISLHLYSRQSDGQVMAPLVLLAPLGLLWGLAFPVGAAFYARSRAAAGRTIADLYAWNTLGCIAGALGAGFVLIPLLGVSRSAASLAAVNLLLGLALLWQHPQGFWGRARLLEWSLAAAAVLLLARVGDPYYRLIQRKMAETFPQGVVVYRQIEESAGTTTAFAAADLDFRHKQLWVNGYGMTTLVPATKLMAHLPLALADDPHDVLVVCFGMGTTARSASRHAGLQIHIVELLPGVLKCFDCYHADGPQILEQPNVNPVIDDGRNYLLLRPQQYDVITIDPAPPLDSAGSVNLYSRQFFELCRQRLRPGGVVCLWVPPASASEVKMILRTYLDAFEHVQAWCGPGSDPGFLLIGSRGPLRGVPEKIHQLYRDAPVADDLREWGTDLDQPEKILDLYVGDERQLRDLAGGAPVITDDSPYTEFPLWRRMKKNGEYSKVLRATPYKGHWLERSFPPGPSP